MGTLFTLHAQNSDRQPHLLRSPGGAELARARVGSEQNQCARVYVCESVCVCCVFPSTLSFCWEIVSQKAPWFDSSTSHQHSQSREI